MATRRCSSSSLDSDSLLVVGALALIGAWIAVRRGPSVPDHATLILRIGGDLAEMPRTTSLDT